MNPSGSGPAFIVTRRSNPASTYSWATSRCRFTWGPQANFTIDDVATEPFGDGQPAGGRARTVEVTLHVHGKRPVSELACALSDLDFVDAVLATDTNTADD